MRLEPENQDVLEIIKHLRYELYDPAKPSLEQKDLLDQLNHLRAFHSNEVMTVKSFGDFSLLNAEGWQRIRYQTQLLASGHIYWITDQHAEMIGRAIGPNLQELMLELSTLQGDGFSIMAASVTADVRLNQLYISHQSGDEVTAIEAQGLARLATRLQAKRLHLWAPEFTTGSLDILAQEVSSLSNHSLIEVDICDTSKTEPADRLVHPGLEEIIARNHEKGRELRKEIHIEESSFAGMAEITEKDRAMAKLCVACPVCRHARKKQNGLAFFVVKKIESGICPACAAYEKVYGRKAHEPIPATEGKK